MDGFGEIAAGTQESGHDCQFPFEFECVKNPLSTFDVTSDDDDWAKRPTNKNELSDTNDVM